MTRTDGMRFVHVGFAFPGVPKVLDLQPHVESVCQDWIRYSPLCWILWTNQPTATIYNSLARGMDTGDHVLISALVAEDLFGRMSPWVWDWMNSKRLPQPILYGHNLGALPSK